MKPSSEQYKEEMKFPFRNKWLINLYIGLINEKFQSSAYLIPLNEVSFLTSNYNNYLFSDITIDERIASFEKNIYKADGSSLFIDKIHTNIGANYYGFISKYLSDENNNIDFSFKFTSKTKERGLKGLTLYFDETYPSSFTLIVNSRGEKVFEKTYINDSLIFQTEDVFSDYGDEMVIKINQMNKPYVRFRLRYILFGIGVRFNNEKFLSTGGSLKSFMHPCSVELPTQELSVKLDNYNESFDFDKKSSIINLATIGQDATLQIQYILDNGDIETVSSTSLELSSYVIDGSSLSLNCVDFIRNENKEIVFDDPALFNPSTTLYDIAMKVKQNITNLSFELIIDDALKDIPMKFSHIQTTVKEALMMISSAGKCIMDLKDKKLFIRRVDYISANLTSQSNNKAPYSDVNVLTPDNVINFATLELDRVKANGAYLFASDKINSMFKTGYISQSISNEYGLFENKPYFEILSDEAINPSFLSLIFNSTEPRSITIKTYFNNELKEEILYNNLRGNTFEVLYDFIAFNKIVVEFNEIYESYSRVYVSNMSFDKNIYDMTKSLYLSKVPKGYLLDTIRNIIISYQTSTKINENFEDIVQTVTVPCNDKGFDMEYENPFITTKEVALDVGEWLKKYYATRIEYDFDYVGDPTLEVNDIIRLQNNYNDNLLCDIENCDITFSNGGINGKIRARRRQNDSSKSTSIF